MKNQNKRIIYLDILRVIAIFFVIFNHTGIDGFFLFSLKSPSHLPFWIYSFISVFSKFAVYIFFMISGSLYLKKENLSLKDIYLKKILKTVLITLIFSIIYYLYLSYRNNIDMSLVVFLKKLITCKISVHFWYLYMYIAFLMSIPFLKIIIEKMDKKLFNYLIILALLFEGILPCINFLIFKEPLSYSEMLSPLWCINMIFIYPIIGYYLDNKVDLKNNKKRIYFLWILNIILIIATILMTLFYSNTIGVLSEAKSQVFYTSFVIVNAMTMFLTTKYLVPNNGFTKLIAKLGKYSFGIYLIHILIIKTPIYKEILLYLKDIGLNSGLLSIVLCMGIYLASLIITFILSKIPIIKKTVGF